VDKTTASWNADSVRVIAVAQWVKDMEYTKVALDAQQVVGRSYVEFCLGLSATIMTLEIDLMIL